MQDKSMGKTGYDEEEYRRRRREGRYGEIFSKMEGFRVKKAVQQETLCKHYFYEKEGIKERKDIEMGIRRTRKRSVSPFYKEYSKKSSRKMRSMNIHDKTCIEKRREKMYERRSPCENRSRGISPFGICDKRFNSRSPVSINVSERRYIDDLSRSRSNSLERYSKSPKHVSMKKETNYSPEYYKNRHFYHKHKNHFLPSLEDRNTEYQKTSNHINEKGHQHSLSFSASSSSSSYNHSSYKSNHETNHYNSRFASKENYKNNLSASYHKDNTDTARISYTAYSHEKHRHANDLKDSRYRYSNSRSPRHRSSFSNKLNENNKETNILYESPDSYTESSYATANTHKYKDISDKNSDYRYDTENSSNYTQSVQKSHKKLHDTDELFNKTPLKIMDLKKDVAKKQDDTIGPSFSGNTKHSMTPIISFKLSNTKNTLSTSRVYLDNTTDLNETSYPPNKIQESKTSLIMENAQNEFKLSKRSFDFYDALKNNENLDSSLMKKSRKSSENIPIRDPENNINYSNNNNIHRHSEDSQTQKNVSIKMPIAKITMMDSKEGFVYERIGQVGEGTYGKVYKARNRITNELVALKKIRMEYEKNGFPITAMREIKLLQSLKHPNVVCLLEMMVEKSTVYMVFEYMDHDLSGVLSNPNFRFEPSHAKHLCKQMLDGLEYLHHRGVLHRDIKGSNILLDNFGQLKLADFGLARYYHKKRDTADYTNRVITLWFRPPELLLGATAYGPAVDIWSAGCIMIELFTRKPLFPGHDEIHQLELIYDMMGTPTHENWPSVDQLPWFELLKPSEKKIGKFYDRYSSILSPAALSLLSNILALDPSKRPTATDALKHTFFTQEEPKPMPPLGLGNMKGDWHEYESKRRRKLREDKEVNENIETGNIKK
ncbi:hypothetical protein T552_00974 [Pneumocystis carinii B80]|uniref:Protein kinase domain-containing protein n=1 Tax=Pneumocystis carinii (strain B80) TaxID=1408658 RepID=A0A0W4ZN12_PNEC8|nr:hypothetical protein T552_00974 [Pneumocystis carinii B80]KTW29767.1 hypothetical protein T552_00974 [Pneumocystis carinii B80]